MPYFNDEMGAAIGQGMATNKAFLMGRKLYEEWAGFWPNSDDEFAEFLNSHPKYVVSSALQPRARTTRPSSPGPISCARSRTPPTATS